MQNNKTVDTLSFAGGGVKGVVYAGVAQSLLDYGYWSKIRRVCGTSAGAMVSLLIACGYEVDEIKSFLFDLDFSKMEDDSWFVFRDTIRLFTNYSYMKGKELRKLLQKVVKDKTGDSETSLLDLYRRSGIEFTAVSVNINTRKLCCLNKDTQPTMPAYLATLASSSIPFIFPPVEWEGDLYVDGAAMCNFPVDYYHGDGVLGFQLKDESERHRKEVTGILSFTKCVFNSVMSSNGDDMSHANIVEVDVGTVSSLDFSMDMDTKKWLYNSGKQACDAYLQSNSEARAVKEGMNIIPL
jgi:NTE family protein